MKEHKSPGVDRIPPKLLTKFVDQISLPNIKMTKEHKSPGVDRIPPKLLTSFVDQIGLPLAIFFSVSIKDGIVPLEWKELHHDLKMIDE